VIGRRPGTELRLLPRQRWRPHTRPTFGGTSTRARGGKHRPRRLPALVSHATLSRLRAIRASSEQRSRTPHGRARLRSLRRIRSADSAGLPAAPLIDGADGHRDRHAHADVAFGGGPREHGRPDANVCAAWESTSSRAPRAACGRGYLAFRLPYPAALNPAAHQARRPAIAVRWVSPSIEDVEQAGRLRGVIVGDIIVEASAGTPDHRSG